MEEERFRVSVCLRRYYKDRRSRAYISVIPKNKVQWLHQRLSSLFALDGGFFLLSQGHLLHPDEPLSLLRPDDAIEVVPLPGVPSEVDRDIDHTRLNGNNDLQTQGNLQPLPFEETRIKVQSVEKPMLKDNATDIKLLQMKQQALELLRQFSDVNERYVDEPDVAPAPTVSAEGPKKRRRVRRRKRRTSNEESSNNGHLLDPVEKEITEVHIPDGQTQISSLGPRKPRLVRSLSPP